MHVVAPFEVTAFEPVPYDAPLTCALPVGHAHLVKAFSGPVEGTSHAQFSSAFDPASGVGSYVALEVFDGTVDGRRGSFAFLHSASTSGQDRTDEYVRIVAGSGTGDLAGIHGSGSLTIDDDGQHRFAFDYELG